MASYSLVIHMNGETETLSAPSGCSFLEFLRVAGYSELHAPCGGLGTCKQCEITVTGNAAPSDDPGSGRMVREEKLLSCRWAPAGDCEITIPEASEIEAVVTGAGDIAPCGDGLGIAVDIGTTTVAAFLYDMSDGKLLAVESGRNAQRPFGADVISRIQYSVTEGGLYKLQQAVLNQLDGVVSSLCKKAGCERREISYLSITGNTVMEHILDGLSPEAIGVSPFTPLSFFGDERKAGGFIPGLASDALLYLCPALAGYVGGDVIAGLLHSGAWKSEKPCLYIDIGTNGEMALGGADGFICCATAAGPAFEGAEIECGMDASAGAVNRVWQENGEVFFSTIEDAPARGFCGSGLVDAVAALLKAGAVEESGRMLPAMEAPECVRDNLRRGDDGQMRFYFADDVYISAADIRQIQLAKAAIRAGVETLLSLSGKKYREIDQVLIAGGFGAFLDVRSACTIGLMPPPLIDKARHVGNCAGGGAALALALQNRQNLDEILCKCRYEELSTSTLFMEKYIECMCFDEFEEVEQVENG